VTLTDLDHTRYSVGLVVGDRRSCHQVMARLVRRSDQMRALRRTPVAAVVELGPVSTRRMAVTTVIIIMSGKNEDDVRLIR